MKDYLIGKVIAVTGDRLQISILEYQEEESCYFGVPETMEISVESDNGPIPVLIGQPGSFVNVRIPNGILVCMVVDIDMKEVSLTSKEERRFEEAQQYFIEIPKRIISAIPVGTIDSESKFERGTDVLPTVNSPAYACIPEQISSIYSSYAKGNFTIGKLSLLSSQDALIDLDSYLSRHSAILGQTGCGKSWTVASILQKISRFPQATTVLFDLHSEYTEAFGDYADIISASDLELPYWLMNSEELMGLMIDRTENAAPNQIAKFKELLQKAKEDHDENKQLGIPKITIDTPIYFDFNKILEKFRELDVEMVLGSNGKQKQGPLYGQFTRMLMRIDSRLNDRRYDLIFNPKVYITSASMENLFRKIMGNVKDSEKKIVVIDVSPIPFDVRNSVIALILRCLFDFAYWYKHVNRVAYPIAVFCDEAHIYLNEKDSNSVPARNAAERIAKEGRKYGISLNVISQRPRELSSTILSQCNSFLCLRMSNPDDQSYVKNLLPDSIKGIASMFAVLRRGECIILGDSVIMPTRIKIDKPDPKPASNDISFFEEWSKEISDIDYVSILDAWRMQEI